MKYFISYNESDSELAHWIASRLKAIGHEAEYMGGNKNAGQDFIQMMNEAIITSDKIIPVLSHHYVNSEYSQAELNSFLAKDPLGKLGLIIPVRVDEVNPDGLIASRVYIDLVGIEDETERFQRFYDGIGYGGPIPDPVAQDGAIEEPYRSKVDEQQESKRKHLHPEFGDQIGYMLDREEVLNRIAILLHKQEEDISRPVLCVIHGDKEQCHYMLNWRLRNVEIPNLVGSNEAVVEKSLEWPGSSNAMDSAELHKHLHASLSRRLVKKFVSLDELRNWVSALPNPIIVRSDLLVSNWRTALNESLLRDYIQFWEMWAAQPCRQRVIVFLSIIYDLDMPISFKERFQGLTAKKINDQISSMLKACRGGDRTIFEVLPQLEGITEQHVQDFANRDWLTDHLGLIHHHITRMFEQDKKLSMEEAEKRLVEILKKAQLA